MISTEYANAYSEVLDILRYIPKEDYDKIPNCKIEYFKENQNREYIFEYNPNKTLEEQNVSKRSRAIIALLFRDYWSTEEQKEKIIRKQNYDRQIVEEQKRNEYDIENIFKNKNNTKETEISEETKEVILYKETFFRKIINKIKSLLK